MSDHLARIDCQPASAARDTPVVFVHGAWHGAWCWRENFLPYFAANGYPAYAFDLRGHGGSAGRQQLRRARLADYVDDLDQVVRDLGRPPILIGHSMGGVIVQKYLEARPARAAVLLATLPPYGGIPALLRLAGRYPLAVLRVNLTRSLLHLVDHPDRVRALFFSADVPEERLRTYADALQDESYRAFLDLLALNLPKPQRVRPRAPVLVLGADRDAIISRREVEATARAYHTEAAFFPTAHDMMLEADWRAVADHALHWLDRTMQPAQHG
jgi:pimeloyl-ACP methyl ester carboxylesterase